MSTFNIAAINTAFAGGSSVYQKALLGWDIKSLGVQVRVNVKSPQNLTKFDTDGEPMPYRAQDDFNGATFTDRVLTAYPSKYDQQIDFVELYNTYLAEMPEFPFEQYALQQGAKKFLSKLMTDTLWLGVRNGAGTTAADISDGWGKKIAAAVIAGDIVETATGAITSLNAVDKVEIIADAASVMMKQAGFKILCSYDVLEKYRKHYRTLNAFGFNKNERGQYQLDGINAVLVPAAFMGTSQRLVATFDNNLIFGTDIDGLTNYPTMHLNLLQNRILMNVGCQIRDIGSEVFVVNDVA